MKQEKIDGRWNRLSALALLGALLLGISGCQKAPAQIPDYQPHGNENPFLEETGYKRPEIELDGVLDDEIWADKPTLSFGDERIRAHVKGFYGENGIYVGAQVEDDDLWSGSDKVYENSSFEVYLDVTGKGGKKPQSDHLQLFIDVNEKSLLRRGNSGVWTEDSIIKNYGVSVDGSLNDRKKDKGYGVELFIPYSQLGGESDRSYHMAFGLVDCAGGKRQAWCGIPGVDVQTPDSYYTFDRKNNRIGLPEKEQLTDWNLDGKALEKEWKNRPVYYFGDGGRCKVRHIFHPEGAYFFFEVTDDRVFASGKTVYLNDSVELYLDTKRDGGVHPKADDVQIRADVLGQLELLCGDGTEWKPKRDNLRSGVSVLGGKMNDSAKGYALELFVPWKDLNLKKAPASMKISFGSVDWDGKKKQDGKREISWSGIGSDPQIPNHYITITPAKISGSIDKIPASELKLDGAANEKEWQQAPHFSYHNDMVKVRWFWNQEGCYLHFRVLDATVKTEQNKPYLNSSVEVYLDYDCSGGLPDAKDRTILVDAGGNMLFRRGNGKAYEDFVTPLIQCGVRKTAQGYEVELFVPWQEFGGKKPQKMGIAFGHVTRQKSGTETAWMHDGLCKDPQKPANYAVMTEQEIKK